jgi:hypothetical protein
MIGSDKLRRLATWGTIGAIMGFALYALGKSPVSDGGLDRLGNFGLLLAAAAIGAAFGITVAMLIDESPGGEKPPPGRRSRRRLPD